MDECLAGPGEPLSIHLSQVAECVRKRGAAVAGKLAKVYNMSIEEAEDLLVFVAYAHDVGKTDVEYRDAVDTFRRHEAKSTAAAYEAMRKSEVLKDCKNLDSVYAAALVAVAMHHYVHKEPRLDIDVRGYRRRCGPPVDAWQPKSELGRRLRQALLEVEEAGALCYLKIIESLSKLPEKTRYAAMAILGVLNQCDREVAQRNRKTQQ